MCVYQDYSGFLFLLNSQIISSVLIEHWFFRALGYVPGYSVDSLSLEPSTIGKEEI